MKKFLTFLLLVAALTTATAQVKLDMATIEDIVKNEKQYYNDIMGLYKNDDPYLRTDDIALVYYGQTFNPEYKPGTDNNEKRLNKLYEEGKHIEAYELAQKILEYNPVSLNALFKMIKTSQALARTLEEYDTYARKFYGILGMITQYGDGKSSSNPYVIITPEDQDYVMYGMMGIQKEITREFDKETLCNIILVEPSKEFPSRRMYFNLELFLRKASENKKQH
jgi:hypothetical protein